jgi:Fe2+ or Zn2+ uptake regulation protein
MTRIARSSRRAALKQRPHCARSLDEVRDALQTAGCRYTAQRGEIWNYLAGVDSHPTADEVYRAVQVRVPRISLATVYNALEALVNAGVATRITSGNGSARYDCRSDDHYHLRDVETGEVRDMPTEFDSQLLTKLAPDLVDRLARNGFQVTGYRLEVLGRFKSGANARRLS